MYRDGIPVTHPGTNRDRHTVASFMWRTTLTTMPRHQPVASKQQRNIKSLTINRETRHPNDLNYCSPSTGLLDEELFIPLRWLADTSSNLIPILCHPSNTSTHAIQIDWLVKLRFYIQLDTKQVISEMLFPASTEDVKTQILEF